MMFSSTRKTCNHIRRMSAILSPCEHSRWVGS
ncbi:unnamed protein product [Tuber melanosporum]|uniref:(Perigord truffle) hypothetical protein n=1 Tax=Tuber melanosporum (strain Mel28) TaxID=656061 RepID=D5GHY9_TUBMM|nr:uncharacterized protein GSTUM_00008193001 [Tuber melanosporum]CAZ84132.1 unnamed protein product [Tuber melanosporum]